MTDQTETTARVDLTRREMEALIIGTEASRLKPILRHRRHEDAARAEAKLYQALRAMGWYR